MKYGVFGLWLVCVLCYFAGAIMLMWQTAMEAGTHVMHSGFYNGIHVFGVTAIRYMLIGIVVMVLNHYTTKLFEKVFSRAKAFPF